MSTLILLFSGLGGLFILGIANNQLNKYHIRKLKQIEVNSNIKKLEDKISKLEEQVVDNIILKDI